MIIDTHGHLNFKAFDQDFKEVIDRCNKEGVAVINVGSNYDTSKKAVNIALNNDSMYSAIGIHPIHAKEFIDIEDLYQKKVVAIGEIGLDYFRDYGEFKEKQKEVFLKQLSLAQKLNLPIIVHCRKAHEDLIKILEEKEVKGVIHCFTGRWREAEKYLEMGFYLGFNGIIFKFDLEKVIKNTPLDRILVETDCPYLAPPQANQERNEPVFVKYVIEEIARIKELSFEEVAFATSKNAQKLFKLDFGNSF